jgi:hypothetical protein
MTMQSDPTLKVAERQRVPHVNANAGQLVAPTGARAPERASRRKKNVGIYALLTVMSIAVLFRAIAPLFASPLDDASTTAAPPWMMQVTTTGSKPGIALAFGADVGIQILRIPAGQGSNSEARILPARLARGEVHMISLSLTSLHVEGKVPTVSNGGMTEFSATVPILTVYKSGVRAWW